ncbi:MAG: 1-aminocyclopropane-1-carboxylate deaminase/D-cysteine desulfhydrase [Pseudomonadales bacterium]
MPIEQTAQNHNALRTIHYAGQSFRLLDLTTIHPSGNKYFKLKYNLLAAREAGQQTLLSFGGAWSNHIHALALCGAEQGFNTIGVIRGEAPARPSAMLVEARAAGMQLHFVSREQYRRRGQVEFHAELRNLFGDFCLVPEGGSNLAGVQGAREIVRLLEPAAYGHIVVPVGTGGTLAGIALGLPENKTVTGVCVLKGAEYLQNEIKQLVGNGTNWQLDHFGHEGGYAKVSPRLKSFLQHFEGETGVPLEPVYTAKMLLRLVDLFEQGSLDPDNTVAVHTGGLQGRRGFDF